VLAASIWAWIAVVLVAGLLLLAVGALIPVMRSQKKARARRIQLEEALREATAREAADRDG